MKSEQFWGKITKYFEGLVGPAILDTLLILAATMLIAIAVGFVLGLILVATSAHGLHPNKKIYGILNFIVNFVRSFPIMILIVALLPVTHSVMGTTIGVKGAIFPLSVAASPFMARIFENALMEVDPQLIEAARSFGANDFQILTQVMLKEAIPSIVSGITLATVTYLSATTIAGAIGAGGLGSVAINYGYYRFDNTILYTSVIILCIMVQLIQWVGGRIIKKLRK